MSALDEAVAALMGSGEHPCDVADRRDAAAQLRAAITEVIAEREPKPSTDGGLIDTIDVIAVAVRQRDLARRESAQYAETVDRLLAMIRRCEWRGRDNYSRDDVCPTCENTKENGHADDCELWMAIR